MDGIFTTLGDDGFNCRTWEIRRTPEWAKRLMLSGGAVGCSTLDLLFVWANMQVLRSGAPWPFTYAGQLLLIKVFDGGEDKCSFVARYSLRLWANYSDCHHKWVTGNLADCEWFMYVRVSDGASRHCIYKMLNGKDSQRSWSSCAHHQTT